MLVNNIGLNQVSGEHYIRYTGVSEYLPDDIFKKSISSLGSLEKKINQ